MQGEFLFFNDFDEVCISNGLFVFLFVMFFFGTTCSIVIANQLIQSKRTRFLHEPYRSQ